MRDTVPENVWGVRRQYSVSVDEVLDGFHSHDHEVGRSIGMVARQQKGPKQVLQQAQKCDKTSTWRAVAGTE